MNRSLLYLAAIAAAWIMFDRWSGRPIEHAPGVLVVAEPSQIEVGGSVFRHGDYIVTRRARFSIEARVLSTERYWLGREADLSPLDLALGWRAMSDQALLDKIKIRQGGRWYHTGWAQPLPVAEQDVSLNSANMHMIPDRGSVERGLKRLRPGDVVRLQGFLVDVDHPSGWHWRTSLTRADTGAGACEIVYVENLEVLTEYISSN